MLVHANCIITGRVVILYTIHSIQYDPKVVERMIASINGVAKRNTCMEGGGREGEGGLGF